MRSVAKDRKWLTQLRMDAADALVQDTVPFAPEWDTADMHEDFRETLGPFFDRLADLVDRQEKLREVLLMIRDESQQLSINSPFDNGPAIVVSMNAYDSLVEALGYMTQAQARNELATPALVSP